MTYQETLDKAQDRAHNAAKSLYEKAKDLTHGAAEHIEEPVNEAAKSLNEVVKEQWGKITENYGEENTSGNLMLGVFVGVASILFVYGVCKAVNYFEKPKNGK